MSVLDDGPGGAWAPGDPELPILTAVTDSSAEADLVSAFGAGHVGVSVVRRCVDLVELLSAASLRSARAALVSADLRGLDRAAVSQLAGYGVATVGVAAGEGGERLLHQLGVSVVVPVGAPTPQVAGALHAAAQAHRSGSAEPSRRPDPTGERPAPEPAGPTDSTEEAAVIAVWGPTGAPGRSTVALGLADALANRVLLGAADPGAGVLLIDADPYGGSLAQMCGLLDEAPGLAAACRAGNAGTLDVARLATCARRLTPGLGLLTGLDEPARWPELRPAALELVLRLARRFAAVTVVDCGFCLEDPDPFADTGTPRRNAATLTALRAADRVLMVAAADPVGLTRAVRDLPHLADALGLSPAELLGSGRLAIVANRVRPGLAPGDARRGIAQALEQHAGVELVAALPLDQAGVDRAGGRAQLLSEAAAESELAAALLGLAVELAREVTPGRLRVQTPGRRRRPGRRRADRLRV